MKTLYLVRHAKSDWKNDRLSDQYRPLNERGYSDAIKMSLSLNEKKIVPDLVITSPAIRAYSTAMIFCEHLNYDASRIIIRQNLYESTVKEYLETIAGLDDTKSCVFLFGHNGTITNTANRLTATFTDDLPTCGVIGLQTNNSDWKNFTTTPNELVLYDFPKNN